MPKEKKLRMSERISIYIYTHPQFFYDTVREYFPKPKKKTHLPMAIDVQDDSDERVVDRLTERQSQKGENQQQGRENEVP